MNELVWRVEALQEFDAAFQWYEEQRIGLGTEFARDADAQVRALQRFPRSYPVVLQDIRRTILKRFPFRGVLPDRGIADRRSGRFAPEARRLSALVQETSRRRVTLG